MSVITHDEYKKYFADGIIKELKSVCSYCGKELIENPGNVTWKCNRTKSNIVFIFWHRPCKDYIFHAECAMNFAIDLITDARFSKFQISQFKK